jgi:hypothetical protein
MRDLPNRCGIGSVTAPPSWRAAGVTIEHIAKNHIRKEDVVAKVLALRGDDPGLVRVITAMEACDRYTPWHNKRTHRIKRVTGTYRYYLTRTGRAAIGAARRLIEHTIILALA